MITVDMSDDISKYENKVVGPFTARQVKAIGIGALYSLPIAIFSPVSMSNKIFVFIALMVPALLCGFVSMNGSYFEFLGARLLYLFFLTPRKRKAKDRLEFYEDIKAMEKDLENKRLSKMTSSQRRQYEKTHGKNREVTYSQKKEFKIYK